ncbi:MAG TPA: four-carbon acid sugar kinase family protein, partial [Firmicutes bacterium]|nr:four-carbon acid sugar kinase family protein [Bacillota bacterium]
AKIIRSQCEVGRTTKDAVHFLNNVRLTATEFAKDPHKPVLEDNIQKLLQAGLKENVSHHNLQQIREGKINFGGARIHTFDAEDNQDLEKIARAAQATEKEILWVGSAGLANMIISVDKPFKPGLAIVGSLSEVSRTQVEYGQKMGMGLLEIHMGHILKGKKATSEIEKAVETLKRGEDLIITTSYDLEAYEEALRVGRELKMSREEIGFAVPKALGDICAEIIKKTPVAGIFVTGGDTAMGFLNSVKATGSTIIQEIITGIPLVRLNGGDFDGLKLVTKAGGFGDEKALHYSLAKIKESS